MAFRHAFQQFPILDTGRLLLSEISPEEYEQYYAQQKSALDIPNRPSWSFGYESQSAEHTRNSLDFAYNAWKKKARLRFGIRLKDKGNVQKEHSSKLIGCCELFNFTNQYKAEMGYWLGADYHRQGIMTEAVHAVVTYAFGPMEMNRIYVETAVENTPSIDMLRKAGFTQEGLLRQDRRNGEGFGDTVLLAILKEDFQSR